MKTMISISKTRQRLIRAVYPALCVLAMGGSAFADATSLIASGRASLVAHNIVAADKSFQQAVAADPTNQEANALYAMTRVIVLETTPQVQKLLDRMEVSRKGRDVFAWTARPLRNGFPPPGSSLNTNDFEAVAKQTLLPEIINAEKNLEQITDTTFTTPLSMDETNMPSVTIDYGDFQVLRALLYGAEATINLDDSYNTVVRFSDIASWMKMNALTVQNLLKVYPKLLTFENQSSVGTALTAFDNSVTAYVNGSAFIRSRADNTNRLFVIDPNKAAEEATYRLDLQKVQASLATTVNFDTRTKIYLGALQRMTQPPRWYLPEFNANHAILGTSGTSGTSGGISTTSGTFPDPTFDGGLLTVSAQRSGLFCAEAGDKLDKLFHYKNESFKSTVSITSPKANVKVAAPNPPTYTVTVTGHAKKNAALARVEVSLNSDDDSAFAVADGTTDWSFQFINNQPALNPANVQPGINRIYARGVDTSGNRTPEQSRSFTYVVKEALPVSINPPNGGTVTAAFVPNSQRQLGKTYVIKAKPVKGNIFQSWSAPSLTAYYSDQARYSFPMTHGLSLQANFIPNPFPAVAGQYAGQLLDSGSNAVGSADFTITETGVFTGKLVFGGKTYHLKGTLDAYGGAVIDIPPGANASIELIFFFPNIANGFQGMTVQVTGTDSTALGQANRSATSTSLKGKYSLIMRPDITAPDSPQGNGYGTVTIRPNAKVSFAGVLADGTPLTYSTILTGTRGWSAYVPIYDGRGSFSGTMNIHVPGSQDDIDGTPAWIKPPAPKDKIYQQGFTAKLTAVGSVNAKTTKAAKSNAGALTPHSNP